MNKARRPSVDLTKDGSGLMKKTGQSLNHLRNLLIMRKERCKAMTQTSRIFQNAFQWQTMFLRIMELLESFIKKWRMF